MKSEQAKRNFAAYQAEWDKSNTTIVTIKLNHNTDADIIRFLETQPSKAGTIKKIIKSYLSQNRDTDL